MKTKLTCRFIINVPNESLVSSLVCFTVRNDAARVLQTVNTRAYEYYQELTSVTFQIVVYGGMPYLSCGTAVLW